MRMNDDKKHMIRTNLRNNVQLKESVMLGKLHHEVVGHAMKHICIWQQIRTHFIKGFSDKCDENDVPVCCVCFDGTFKDKNHCNIEVYTDILMD